MKGKMRHKEILGIVVGTEDGYEWLWEVGERHWKWSGKGFLEHQKGQGNPWKIVIFTPRIEGAVAYTAGFQDGEIQATLPFDADPGRR